MTGSDTRREAIEAGNAALRGRFGYEPASGDPADAYWVHALDAIPASVLARLAVERGGLKWVGWQRPMGRQQVGPLFPLARKEREHRDDTDDSTLKPVYRIVEATDE